MEDRVFLFRCLKCNQLDRLDYKGLEQYVFSKKGEYDCPYGCKAPVVLMHVGTLEESHRVRKEFERSLKHASIRTEP